MAVIQLTGGSQQVPTGALNVRLSTPHGVELVFLDADGAAITPNFQVTRVEAVIVPAGPVTVAARTADGRPFQQGARLGVAVKSASGSGDEVVRSPSDVGGRQQVALVEISEGLVTDLLGAASAAERAWMQRGNYAYHVNHRQGTGRATPWSVVLDGSAATHHTRWPERYQQYLELVFGIAVTGFGSPPAKCIVATQPPRDVTATLDGEEIAWETLLGHDPAPWPSLGDAVDQALAPLPSEGALVIVTDGVFVDYREVRERLGERRCIVVAMGRSQAGARVADRPEHFWEEELQALQDYHVVSLAALDGLDDEAFALADGMFPGGMA